MSPILIGAVIGGYFLMLIAISWFTNRNTDDKSFYLGNRQAPWYLISFGMIGASLSGVTFISVPGVVGNIGHINGQFSYLQVVMGYFVGYIVIARVLLPIYYNLNLVSIYGYLEQRFGYWSYKTGSAFFLLSRLIGSSFRLFLTAGVLHHFIFSPMGVPFWLTVAVTIVLIYIYTFKGGIKTIIYTDTIQTAVMLAALGLTIYMMMSNLDMSVSELFVQLKEKNLSKMFFWDSSPRNFWKQFGSGFLIALVMTGLDQDMMQKNLSCKNLKEAQKNLYTLSFTMIVVTSVFVIFGGLLYLYAWQKGIAIPEKTDLLYPVVALEHFGGAVGILFIIGLIAAAYSSADSTLTALTTAFVVDFLDFEKKGEDKKTRSYVHIGFAFITFLMIIAFDLVNDDSVITNIFKAAGFTYGPLLGLFAFGIASKRQIKDNWVPIICISSMLFSFVLNAQAANWFNGYKIGFEILFYNGLLTFIGLWLSSYKQKQD
jgi:Na+/proline symporter